MILIFICRLYIHKYHFIPINILGYNYQLSINNKNLVMRENVLVSCCWCKKFVQTWWLKETNLLFFVILQFYSSEVLKLRCQLATFLLETLGKKSIFPSFQHLGTTHILGSQPFSSSSQPATQHLKCPSRSLCYHIFGLWHSFLLMKTLVITLGPPQWSSVIFPQDL